MALGGQLWVNVFVIFQSKHSEFYWSLAEKIELEQLARGHGKKNWTKKVQDWENTKQLYWRLHFWFW